MNSESRKGRAKLLGSKSPNSKYFSRSGSNFTIMALFSQVFVIFRELYDSLGYDSKKFENLYNMIAWQGKI